MGTNVVKRKVTSLTIAKYYRLEHVMLGFPLTGLQVDAKSDTKRHKSKCRVSSSAKFVRQLGSH